MALEQKIRDGKETLIYDIARPEDLDEAVVLVADSFSKSSPFTEIDSISDPLHPDGLFEWRKSLIQKCFAQPTSIIVREKTTKEVIAFVSMAILERADHNNNVRSDIVDRSHPGWLIEAIEQELERGIDLYEYYGTDRILYMCIGVVRKDYRREKVFLSRAYLALENEIIKKYAPGAMIGHAFSRFAGTAKIFEVIRSIDYDSFQLSDGTRPLAGIDLGVHRTARLIAAKLPFKKKNQLNVPDESNKSISIPISISKQCRGFANVTFKGNKTATTTNSGGTETRRTESINHTAKEEYFSIKMPLIAASSRDGKMSLEVGQHSYQFTFVLPNSIPSSFEGIYGHVRYTVKGTIERPWSNDNYCTLGFTVNSLVDLNQNAAAKMGGSATDSTTLGCCCWESGPITAKCWIEQSGYVPGQTLHFNGDVENRSGKVMNGSRVRFIEVTTYHAEGKTEETIRIIKEMQHGPFGQLDLWVNEPIMIPSVAPSGIPYCSIIHTSYRIQYIVDPGVMSWNLNLPPLEVIIGSIPILPSTNLPVAPQISNYPENVDNQHQPMRIGLEDLPPRYEDCFFLGPSDIRDDVNQDQDKNTSTTVPFTPRYVSYLPTAPSMV